MANIKKSFNFRNGVQVDDDNLVVSATGLIGIGTSVPTQALDIRGDFVCTGLTSSVTGKIGVLTVTSLDPTEIIGAGVSIKSGIITGQAGDIVTYFGDGGNLLNLPTSQWEDTNAGFGVSSIYNTGGTVGIATTNPQSTLQIGNDPNNGQIGVGIASAGNIRASGIITANSFSGPLIGDVTGNVTGNVTGSITGNVTGNITGNLTGNLTGLVNSTGISTFAGINATGRIVGAATSNVIPFLYGSLSDLPSAGTYHGAFAHVHSQGKAYFAHAGAWYELVNKDTSGDVSITGDVDVTGGITATGVISGQQVSGTVSVNTAALNATNATIGSLSAQDGISVKDLRIATGSNRTLITTPVGVATVTISGGDLKLQDKIFIDGTNPELRSEGNITLSNSARIGVGTISPENDIQVRRFTGNAEIQVTADSGTAGITVGRETGTGNTNNAEFRYGSTGSPYNTAQSLDIINYGTDNFNYYLSANNAAATAGGFHWHKGINNSTLMTLTGIGGSLGIGLTNPSTPLHVQGNATISDSLTIGNNITIFGSLQLESTFNGNVSGDLTGNVTGNINSSQTSTFVNTNVTGVSTFNSIKADSIGILNDPSLPLTINSDTSQRFFVAANGNVGIKTTDTQGNSLLVAGSIMGQIIGAGTTQALSTVDFSLAGQGLGGAFANKMFMIPPKVTNAQRGNLAGLVSGAMIYNTNLNKLQVYNGSVWETITSS